MHFWESKLKKVLTMTLSESIRKLENSWGTNSFPKHLESIELKNVRGWNGQKIDFKFPITAIVGENGMGKTTILQAAASVYKSPDERGYFASDFFPIHHGKNLQGLK